MPTRDRPDIAAIALPHIDSLALLRLGLRGELSPASFTPPEPGALAAAFPFLDIEALIGQGGMGAVYRVRRHSDQRLAALKILPPELGCDPAFAARFEREYRMLARLDHPHLVAVHDLGRSGPWCWILMELVEGATLREVLRQGRLEPEETLRIIVQICTALEAAHRQGVIHRDIKPENILIDGRGQVKLADFGLAKLHDQFSSTNQALTLTGQLLGTAHYIAPEQIEAAKTVDHRADLYALGVVFYEMLTGTLPLGRFDAPGRMVALDPGIDSVVMRCLAKSPDRRWANANAIATAISAIVADPKRLAASSGQALDGKGNAIIDGDIRRESLLRLRSKRGFSVTMGRGGGVLLILGLILGGLSSSALIHQGSGLAWFALANAIMMIASAVSLFRHGPTWHWLVGALLSVIWPFATVVVTLAFMRPDWDMVLLIAAPGLWQIWHVLSLVQWRRRVLPTGLFYIRELPAGSLTIWAITAVVMLVALNVTAWASQDNRHQSFISTLARIGNIQRGRESENISVPPLVQLVSEVRDNLAKRRVVVCIDDEAANIEAALRALVDMDKHTDSSTPVGFISPDPKLAGELMNYIAVKLRLINEYSIISRDAVNHRSTKYRYESPSPESTLNKFIGWGLPHLGAISDEEYMNLLLQVAGWPRPSPAQQEAAIRTATARWWFTAEDAFRLVVICDDEGGSKDRCTELLSHRLTNPESARLPLRKYPRSATASPSVQAIIARYRTQAVTGPWSYETIASLESRHKWDFRVSSISDALQKIAASIPVPLIDSGILPSKDLRSVLVKTRYVENEDVMDGLAAFSANGITRHNGSLQVISDPQRSGLFTATPRNGLGYYRSPLRKTLPPIRNATLQEVIETVHDCGLETIVVAKFDQSAPPFSWDQDGTKDQLEALITATCRHFNLEFGRVSDVVLLRQLQLQP